MNRLLTIAVASTIVAASALTARAHVDPADVARRCVAHVDQVAERATDAVIEDTLDCLEEIRRLLRAGRVDAAHAVARRCVQDAREVVRLATAEISDTCAECIRYLRSAGADQLARRVYDHCLAVLDSFDTLLARQRQVLADAFN